MTMPIIVNLDVMMAKRKISLGELAERMNITPSNLSILRQARPRPYGFRPLSVSAVSLDASLATYWSIVLGLTIWRQKNNNKQ